jgi:ferredoxin-NADP reductase
MKKMAVKVNEIIEINSQVKRFSFVRLNGKPMLPFSGGAHTVVEMNDGGIKRLNAYSLMGNPHDLSSYSISVRRNDEGRGGSRYMHNHVKQGMEMLISNPVNLFALNLQARKHLFIAGGIGITPFLAQMKQLSAINANFELHYAVHTNDLGPYINEITHEYPNNSHIYCSDKQQRIDFTNLLNRQPLGTHVYVCGPRSMIDSVRSTSTAAGWPKENVHFEEFLAPEAGSAFKVKLNTSNKIIPVGEQQSLLEALEAAKVDVPYLCRGGACGQCETKVLKADGELLHHDHWLTEEEKSSGKKIMPCVSRFGGKTLVIDR